MQIRLDRFISERTEYTRSQIKEMVKKGMVTVNSVTAKACDLKIDDNSTVEVCGKMVSAQKYRYILLNKPDGYVSSTSEHDGKNVLELVPPEMRTKGMFPAGRLDKDSLGALLLTDDGELAHRMLSPKKHVPKIYIVKLDRPFENKYIDIFNNCLKLSDGHICMPAKVKGISDCEKLAFIELCEGKYHQVKRMFYEVENNVNVLMRVSVGGLILPEKLAFGDCMELLHKDVENIFKPLDFDTFCANFSAVFSAILINK